MTPASLAWNAPVLAVVHLLGPEPDYLPLALELGPDGAVVHTSLHQPTGCLFELICLMYGGGLDNQRHSKTRVAQCISMQPLINGVETTNFNLG
jgi:hypothetical protein